MAYKGLYSENSNPNTHDGQSEATYRTIGCTVTERVDNVSNDNKDACDKVFGPVNYDPIDELVETLWKLELKPNEILSVIIDVYSKKYENERVAEAMKEYFQFETVKELEDEINKKIETISIKR